MDVAFFLRAVARQTLLTLSILLTFIFAAPAYSQHSETSRLDAYNIGMLDSPASRFEPMMGVDVGFTALQRSGVETTPFIFSDLSEVIATTDIMEPELTLGSRVAISLFNLHRSIPGIDTDFVFLGMDENLASPTVNTIGFATTAVHPRFYGGFPVSSASSYTMFLDAEMKSFEWSIGYRPIARLRVTTGVRSFSWDEEFDVLRTESLSGRAGSGFFSEAKNEAIGVQFGGEATLWTNGRARVFAKGKYAILNNDVEGQATAANASLEYEGDKDTFLIDVELGGSIWISRWASLQVAYQGLFLEDGVGTMEQSAAQSFFVPTSQVPSFHQIDWHGLHFGLRMVW